MPLVKIGISRQVTIPKPIHDDLGLSPSDYLRVEQRGWESDFYAQNSRR